MPPGVVTLTFPDTPDPTTAVILVAELTVNEVAATPPKLTAVAPVKFVPVIVIDVPVPPLVGVNAVTVGGGTNVNPANDAVPPGVVTFTFPVAPIPTTAVILVAELTVNEVAATPPKLTAVAPVKFVPVIVTDVPAGTSVTITGTNFTGATAVSFGGVAATSFTVNSATSITAVVGIGATGNVNVTTPGGTASLAGFTFVPPPTVTAFTPTSGGTGTSITITGTNFTGATAVSFGGVAATSFTVNSATSITAVVGSGVSGNVSVTTPGGTATLPGFIFNTVTGISSPSVNSFELRIYPNPVIDMATIIHPSSNKNTQIRLIDITGKIVKVIVPMRNTAQSQVDLKILPAGIYNLIWSDGSRILSRTLMIK